MPAAIVAAMERVRRAVGAAMATAASAGMQPIAAAWDATLRLARAPSRAGGANRWPAGDLQVRQHPC